MEFKLRAQIPPLGESGAGVVGGPEARSSGGRTGTRITMPTTAAPK